jgi:predicted phage terminase large subunit-like protein
VVGLGDDISTSLLSVVGGDDMDVAEASFQEFVRRSWHVIDPGTRLVWGYPMEAICEHIAAIDSGHITRLLITVPPGFSKSSISNVAFPAWAWLRRPHLRFIAASYSERLTFRDNDRCRSVILSDWYQQRWGHRFKLGATSQTTLKPANRADHFANDRTGWKLGTSVGADLLGWRGDVIILDDPNSPKVESEAVRLSVNRWFTEVVPTRFNDMDTGALILIQQRMHLEDCAGMALSSEYTDWVHCNIAMEYEPRPYCNGYRADGTMIETFLDDEVAQCDEVYWQDWRSVEGELAWPERFSYDTVQRLKGTLGPTMAAAQLQQHPIPRGGAIIKTDWWRPWPVAEPPPPLSYLIASFDTAYTEDTALDPSAGTYWGVTYDEYKNPMIFLLWAWQEHLSLHALVQRVIDTCQISQRPVDLPRFPVHKVLIEDATVGKSVNQEIVRLLRLNATFGVELIAPQLYGGDKVNRLYSVEHVFANGLIHTWPDRKWADQVMQQCASVPYTKDDHLADTVAQAVHWLRACGYAPPRVNVSPATPRWHSF